MPLLLIAMEGRFYVGRWRVRGALRPWLIAILYTVSEWGEDVIAPMQLWLLHVGQP